MKNKSPALRKLYYSISETAELSGVPSHTLRYWENEFPVLCPRKGRAGNRLYQQQDIEVIRRIKALLYEQKYTIAGAKTELGRRKRKDSRDKLLKDLKGGLQEILNIIDNESGRGAVR